MPYIIPLILIILGIALYDSQQRTHNRQWLYWGIYVYIVILFGLRYKLGWDTQQYMVYYYNFPDLAHASYASEEQYDMMQPGFKLLWMILKSISDEFWVFQIVLSIFVNAVVMWFFKSHTKYWFTALLIYYVCFCIYFNTEIQREVISICIFLLSYKSLMTRRWVKYYICAFLAFMFHVSAAMLFFYPLLVFFPIKFNKKLLIPLLFIALLGYIVTNYFTQIVSLLGGGVFSNKFLNYGTQYTRGDLTKNWLLVRLFLYSIFPAIIVYIYKFRLKRKIPFETFICLMMIFGVSIVVLAEMGVRLTNYCRPLYFLACARLIAPGLVSFSRRKILSYSLLAMVLVAYSFQMWVLNASTHTIAPYTWIINPQEDEVRNEYSVY